MDDIKEYCAGQLYAVFGIVDNQILKLEVQRRTGSTPCATPSSEELALCDARESIVRAIRALTKDA